MKQFRYTYQLLKVLTLAVCLGGCAQDDDILETENKEESETRMSLVINTPSTNEIDGTSYQYEQECYINDVAVYIFDENDNLKEQITNPVLSPLQGDDNNKFGYRVFGVLTGNYAGVNVKVVVLTNLNARGVNVSALNVKNLEDLSNLTYSFDLTQNNAWKFQESEENASYTPMYGVSNEISIKDGEINEVEDNISLYRAIARIDVVFDGEEEYGEEKKGLKGFTVTGVALNRYNTKGTCATDDLTRPRIPEEGGIVSTEAAFFEPSEGTDVYREDDALTYPKHRIWRLYIPEYKNIESEQPAKLTITGQFEGDMQEKTYTLEFVDTDNNNAPIDIIRNNLYIFRITSIAQPLTEDINCSLKVEEWTSVDNYVEFN